MSEDVTYDIIYIEDNEFDIELTLRAFKKLNLEASIKVIKDGEEAVSFFDHLKALNTALPKLILLDIKLPKVNGLEILQKIKSDEKLKIIPVIMLTYSKEEKDLKEAYSFGANSYILKALTSEQFQEVVRLIKTYWLELNYQLR